MIKITRFKEYVKGPLAGFADIQVSNWADFYIRNVSVFITPQKRWISFPSEKMNEKDENGKDKYIAHCGFKDFKTKQSFDDKFFEVLEQYKKDNPEPKATKSKESEFTDNIPF